ncbi:ribokinase-like isoform X2 [Cynara cardunculus var. scolymus]|uniref:ribokinase-like isoform X2 n=1 Tax=Cynara cardunculus var. scolymus TaxID=59895 RepID=UPI000D631355|nr:ribokinase-like isoform X2 [Cynara cardunculus var. scolymus]
MAAIFSTSAMLHSFIFASSRKSSTPLTTTTSRFRAKMSSSAVTVTSLESTPIVLGFGGVAVDLLATVAAFPNPDDKIRSTSLKVQGGGNAGNALTCAARLGLNARLISKVANDAQGRGILEELEADSVDVSFSVVSEEGNSPFTYVIVDNQTKTRTCIHTPGSPPMIPNDISNSTLLAALAGVKLVYFDVRLPQTALVVAHEANRRRIPILVDAERPREGLDDLLNLSDYVVCSAKLPETWTGAPSVPGALISMLLRLPKVKFVIVTLGADGCIMLERSIGENDRAEEMDVDDLLEQLKRKADSSTADPTCISSDVKRLQAKGIGVVCGKLLFGTAEKIPQSELVDTTGAGDAFIGAVLYSICTNKPPEQMLPFAAQVAAISCRALGARAGLPCLTDPRLIPFSQ